LEFLQELSIELPQPIHIQLNKLRKSFFFQLPFEQLDRYWYGFENGYPAAEVATVMGFFRKGS